MQVTYTQTAKRVKVKHLFAAKVPFPCDLIFPLATGVIRVEKKSKIGPSHSFEDHISPLSICILRIKKEVCDRISLRSVAISHEQQFVSGVN